MWLGMAQKQLYLFSRFSTRVRKCNNNSTCQTGSREIAIKRDDWQGDLCGWIKTQKPLDLFLVKYSCKKMQQQLDLRDRETHIMCKQIIQWKCPNTEVRIVFKSKNS